MSLEKDREKTFGARDDVESGNGKTKTTKEKEEEDDKKRRTAEEEEEEEEEGPNRSSTLFHSQIRFHHLAAATGLIVTYFIEIIVQIFLIVLCCRSFILFTSAWWDWSWFLVLSFAVSSLVVTIVSIVWVCRSLDFAGRLCGRLLCYVMHSLLLGLMWRYLKLAFVYDRADVQEFVALRILQAYFQSLPLTSIHLAWLISSRQNWSSVTLGIVLVEFLSIVTALVLSSYIKSSSTLSSSYASKCSSSSSSSPSSSSSASSSSSSSTSSSCSSSDEADPRIKSKEEEKEEEEEGGKVVMQIIVKNLNCSSSRQKGNSNSSSPQKQQQQQQQHQQSLLWPQLLETKLYILSRGLLLCSRLLVVGMTIVHLQYWTCMFTLVHFLVSFTWISFSVNNSHSSSSHSSKSSHSSSRHILLEEMEEVSLTKGKDFVTLVTEWSYILFWDVTSTLSNNISWSTWILPVLLVMLENGIMILFHWLHQDHPDRLVSIVSGSCLIFGWLLFSSLNFVKTYNNNSGVTKCCSHNNHNHHHHQNDKETTNNTGSCSITKDKSQQTLPVIDPMSKNQHPQHPHHHHNHHNHNHLRHQHPLPQVPNSNNTNTMVSSEFSVVGVGSDEKKLSDNTLPLWNNNCKKIHPASWDLSLFSSSTNHTQPHAPTTLPNTYHNINEVLRTKVNSEKMNNRAGRKLKTDSPEVYGPTIATATNTNTNTNTRSSPPEGSQNGPMNPSQSPLLPSSTSTTTWVPDTCCSNDSNGSSNSRNTNTLRETGSNPLVPDLDKSDVDVDVDVDTDDVENGNFVFYFPTDTSVQQSVTSSSAVAAVAAAARFQKFGSDNIVFKGDGGGGGGGGAGGGIEFKKNNNGNMEICQTPGRKIPTKKKSRSASSVSSFNNNIRRYRTSTPIEIKQASRILVNSPYQHNTNNHHVNPKDCKSVTNYSGGSRCYCYVDKHVKQHKNHEQSGINGRNDLMNNDNHNHDAQNSMMHNQVEQSQYENLIEDSYGILICEGESSSNGMGGGGGVGGGGEEEESVKIFQKQQRNNYHPSNHHHPHYRRGRLPSPPFLHESQSGGGGRKKIKVLCAKCLQGHDPLLTTCSAAVVVTHEKSTNNNNNKDNDRTSQVLLALGSPPPPPPPAPLLRQQNHQHHQHHHLHGGGVTGKGKNLLNSDPPDPPVRLENRPLPIPSSPSKRQRTRTTMLSSNSLVNDNADVTAAGDGGGGVENDDDNENENVEEEDDPLPSDTTDYPSETEMTCTVEGDDEQLSVSSNLSTATYTTWPHSTATNLSSMWTTSTMMPQSRFPKEFTSLEYVRTWLLTSQAQASRLKWHKEQQLQQQNDFIAAATAAAAAAAAAATCNGNGRQEHIMMTKKIHRSNTMSGQGQGHGQAHHHQQQNSRRVRFVGVVTKEEAAAASPYVGSVSRSRKSVGRRQGPVGCVPPSSLQLHDCETPISTPTLTTRPSPIQLPPPPPPTSSSSSAAVMMKMKATSLSLANFQPPPKRKQHPVLPHNSVPHPHPHSRHNHNHHNHHNNHHNSNRHNHKKMGIRPHNNNNNNFNKNTNCHINNNNNISASNDNNNDNKRNDNDNDCGISSSLHDGDGDEEDEQSDLFFKDVEIIL